MVTAKNRSTPIVNAAAEMLTDNKKGKVAIKTHSPFKKTKESVEKKIEKSRKVIKLSKPPIVKWTQQKFAVNHLNNSDFKPGLRSYAHYRDLGMTEATNGAVQAHVIRLIGPCDPKIVSIPHYHGVQFQMVYILKGWMLGEYEGQGKIKMKKGSCWLQPNGIRHTVLDYSDDCEMVEIIMPANFETVIFK